MDNELVTMEEARTQLAAYRVEHGADPDQETVTPCELGEHPDSEDGYCLECAEMVGWMRALA